MKCFGLKQLPLALALCGLCACTGNKTYKISGVINLPETIPYEDTIVEVPSLEGMQVYLFDIDNSVVDSAVISDNHFYFEGELDKDEPAFFVQFVSPVGGALMAVEPGNIDVTITAERTIITGTKANECISNTDEALAAVNLSFSEKVSALSDSIHQAGDELDMELQMSLYNELIERSDAVLDSLYELYKDNIGVGYIVMLKHSDVESVAQLEDALSEYPKEVSENPLVQANMNMLRQYEHAMSIEGIDPSDVDPDTFSDTAE